MLRHMGAFTARGSDGHQYTVNIYIDYIRVGPLGESAEVEGVRHLRLPDGRRVDRIRQGEYEVAGAGLILHSDAADAP